MMNDDDPHAVQSAMPNSFGGIRAQQQQNQNHSNPQQRLSNHDSPMGGNATGGFGSGQREDDGLMPFKRSESHRSVSKASSFRERLASRDASEADEDENFQGCDSVNMNKIVGSKTVSPATSRRNSQSEFSSESQTIMIFDWDDTLFPTTWVRHYMGLHWKYPLDQQEGITPVQRRKIKTALEDLQEEVEGMINLAMGKGHVVIVTLAKTPWVFLSCENFFPRIKKLLEQKQITIVYAQELSFDTQELPPPNPEDPESQERFWVKKKQLAIEMEVRKFYSQYPGQSWKNVISIGDSDFERRATYETMMQYKNSPNPDGGGSGVTSGRSGSFCFARETGMALFRARLCFAKKS